MLITINIIGAVLLGLFAVYIIRGKSQAKRTNEYFCKAVRVYALTNEEDARIAIVTAAKAATKKQRVSMVKYLQSMAADIKKVTENDPEQKSLTAKFVETSIKLAEEISAKEWTPNDINQQKEELARVNPGYLAALDKADPTIFAKTHPQLFK